jgi:hypothetical protein
MLRSPAVIVETSVAWKITKTPSRGRGFERVRGTIDRLEGPSYIVKSRDGAEVKVALAVVVLVEASPGDIKPGLFVGVTAMPRTDPRRY